MLLMLESKHRRLRLQGGGKRVSDEGIKQLKSMLTVVGGRIVYSDLY
ncbi:MAG TPA: hypothetical protein VN885_08300 [Candidatus Acidoferrales bacterium]|nr:hypothetical protein [Candidatus Acidoferrales bacterium]